MCKLIWWHQVLCLFMFLNFQVNCSSSFSSFAPRIDDQISKQGSDGWQNTTHIHLSNRFFTSSERQLWNKVDDLDRLPNLLQGSKDKLSTKTSAFSICNLRSLEILDLSDNLLSGVIPPCLSNLSGTLSLLNLRNNQFHSSIPEPSPKGNCSLKHLSLNGNRLEGPIPRSLINCRSLEVLDLGNNNINDTFPYWLESLPDLKVLILRSNSFHGIIKHPNTTLPFQRLQIFDLSHNDFVGILPRKYLQNFRSMMITDDQDRERAAEPRYVGDGYFSLVVKVTIKGRDIEMTRILTIFKTIDLSSNRFQGEIPPAVGQLESLIVLNFSHNSLTGRIPASFGNLKALESLDLSSNTLVGVIPPQLTAATFLAVLNLSYNRFTGTIPKGNQFNTFENNSYIGNQALCGLPMSRKCDGEAEPSQPQQLQPTSEEESTGWFDWKFASMGYGWGLVFGVSMGYVVFATGKPQWFVRMVEGNAKPRRRRLNLRQKVRPN